MSEIKTDDIQLRILVESIANKVNNSPALNGGFDKMLLMVEHIQDKQEETGEKLNKIQEGLYDPDVGLYSRVKLVETIIKQLGKRQADTTLKEEKNIEDIKISLKKLSEKDFDLEQKTASTTTRLKTIAGDNLEKLEPILNARTFWSKVTWLVVGGILAAAGQTAWALLIHK